MVLTTGHNNNRINMKNNGISEDIYNGKPQRTKSQIRYPYFKMSAKHQVA
jgi:hypothetical protein